MRGAMNKSNKNFCETYNVINEMPLKVLQNVYKGCDIYVLGSGKSMDFYDPEFFKHRVTIGINLVALRFSTQYTVAKDFSAEHLEQIANAGSLPILSRGKYGHESDRQTFDTFHPYFLFPHKQNTHVVIDWNVLGTDDIVVSFSTITSAVHIAAYMGAANIILCGVDSGAIDGETNFTNYAGAGPKSNDENYRNFLAACKQQTIDLRTELKRVYNCNVYSLSPFVNPSFEGHTYEP